MNTYKHGFWHLVRVGENLSWKTARIYLKCRYRSWDTTSFFLLVLGAAILATAADPALAYDGEKYQDVCKKVVGMFSEEGGFASLLTALAGIGAICASAMGGFKMAWALIVVSVGSFILGEYVGLFFDPCN